MATSSGAPRLGQRRAPRWLKLVNPITRFLLRRGVGPAAQHLLSVAGRRTAKICTTPVALVTVDTQRYAVAGFDGSDWVKNVRAAGVGELRRGRVVERVVLTEVPVGQRAPILESFARHVRGGAAFLTAPADASPDGSAAAAARHPVFRVSRAADSASPN